MSVERQLDGASREDTEKRLAVLEERTKPRKKTALDIIKEWGGVATAVIALLYTFPLGVWDRFVTSEQSRQAAQLEEVRDIAISLADDDAKYASTIGRISNPGMATFYTRAVSSRKFMLYSKHEEQIEEFSRDLSAPEIVFLAYSSGQAGKVDLANELFDVALAKLDADADLTLLSDIYRLKAGQEMNRTSGVNIAVVRENFSLALEKLQNSGSDNLKLQYANSMFEWATFEITYGNRECGTKLGSKALDLVSSLPTFIPQVAHYRSQFSQQLAALAEPRDLTTENCSIDRIQSVFSAQ